MEVFGSRPGGPMSESLDGVSACDVFVGIYAHRYGTIPADSSMSITEREFDYAQERGKPTLCFLVDEDFPWPPRSIDRGPSEQLLIAFKRKVTTSFVCDRFATPEDLAFKVASSLGRFLLERQVQRTLEKQSGPGATSRRGFGQVSRRAARLHGLVEGARVLLVNDRPEEMRHVISILGDLGVDVDSVTTSDEAIVRLSNHPYDAVLSDMRRGNVSDEGLRLLERCRGEDIHVPIIFTAGAYRPDLGTPPYAFGITNRVDEILNLLFDILERARG
jgi:CheY-like chemotaxis protein